MMADKKIAGLIVKMAAKPPMDGGANELMDRKMDLSEEEQSIDEVAFRDAANDVMKALDTRDVDLFMSALKACIVFADEYEDEEGEMASEEDLMEDGFPY